MNREELEKYIFDTYGVEGETPWLDEPTFKVFRHENNRKWFAIIMTIGKDKLKLDEDGDIDVVNYKCDPYLIPVLRKENCIFPAYHMNKEHWLTASLDGSVSKENHQFLLDMSYELTGVKPPKKHKN